MRQILEEYVKTVPRYEIPALFVKIYPIITTPAINFHYLLTIIYVLYLVPALH